MEGMNEVWLSGRLGADPRVGKTKGGVDFAVVSLATNRSYRDSTTNERKETTEWHRVEVYGARAKGVADYLRKGSPAEFRGELRTRKWQDREGVDRWTTAVVAGKVVFLPDPNRPPAEKGTSGDGARPPEPPEPPDIDDDIPF